MMSFRKRLKRTANFFKNRGLRSNLGHNLRDSLELIKGKKVKKARYSQKESDDSDSSFVDDITKVKSMCHISDTGLDSTMDDCESSIEETRDNPGNIVVPGIVIDVACSTDADSDLEDTRHLNIKNSTMNQSHYAKDVEAGPDVSPIKKIKKKAKKILLNAGSGMIPSVLDGSSSNMDPSHRVGKGGQMSIQTLRREQAVSAEVQRLALEDRNNNSMVLLTREKEPCIIDPMVDISLSDDDDVVDGWSPTKKSIDAQRDWLEPDVGKGCTSKQATYLQTFRCSTITPAWKQSIAKPSRPSKRSFRTSSPSQSRFSGNLISPNAKRSLLQISSIRELAPDESLCLEVNSGHTVNSDEIVPFSTLSANASRLSTAACKDDGDPAPENDLRVEEMTGSKLPLSECPSSVGCAAGLHVPVSIHSPEKANGSQSDAGPRANITGRAVEDATGSRSDAVPNANTGENEPSGKLMGQPGTYDCVELEDILEAIPSPPCIVLGTTGKLNVITAPGDWIETL